MNHKVFRNPITRFTGLLIFTGIVAAMPGISLAQPITVLTVDCTPFVSPGFGSFGPQQTMGMALQHPLVDPGLTLFAVTEVTPTVFRAMHDWWMKGEDDTAE